MAHGRSSLVHPKPSGTGAPKDGLDPHELEGTIKYLSAVADDVDDKLATEFKARMYLEGGSIRF